MEKVTRFFSIFHIKFSKIDAKSYINRIYNIKYKKDIFSEQFFFFFFWVDLKVIQMSSVTCEDS